MPHPAGAREGAPLLGMDRLEAMLPASMQAWSPEPPVDLAALYAGVEVSPEMLAAAKGGAASCASAAAAVSAAVGEAGAVKQEPDV